MNIFEEPRSTETLAAAPKPKSMYVVQFYALSAFEWILSDAGGKRCLKKRPKSKSLKPKALPEAQR